MLRPVLARCLRHGIRIVSNFGAANPRAAARHIARDGARARHCAPPRIAVIEGDDLSAPAHRAAAAARTRAARRGLRIVSANAYLGAEPIAAALEAGAQIVVCGRVADPSLDGRPGDGALRLARRRLGPARPRHDGRPPARMRRAGQRRLLRRPGFKDVPGLAQVGFPIAEIDADGSCTSARPTAPAGCVDDATVKEQLLYEVHDPAGLPDARRRGRHHRGRGARARRPTASR